MLFSFKEWFYTEDLDNSPIALYHGTDKDSATHIFQHGLDISNAGEQNVSGEFWAATKPDYAAWFAKTNPKGHEQISIVSFEIPKWVLKKILKRGQARRDGTGVFEFLPASYETINDTMKNRRLQDAG